MYAIIPFKRFDDIKEVLYGRKLNNYLENEPLLPNCQFVVEDNLGIKKHFRSFLHKINKLLMDLTILKLNSLHLAV